MVLITMMFFLVHSKIQFEQYFIRPRAKPVDSNTILKVNSTRRSHQCVIACFEDTQCNACYLETNRTCTLFAADFDSRNGILLDRAEGDTYIKGGLYVCLTMLRYDVHIFSLYSFSSHTSCMYLGFNLFGTPGVYIE